MRRLFLLLALLAVSAVLPATADAHPLGNFTVNRYSLLELDRGGVRLTFVLDMAEIPTFQTFAGAADAATVRRWIDRQGPALVGQLRLGVNGSDVPLTANLGGAKASLRAGQGGLPVTRIELRLSGRLPGQGPYSLSYRDDTFGGRPGWKEIVVRAGPGVVLSASDVPTHDVSHMLRSYPNGLLQTPLDVRTASASFRYGEGSSVDVAAGGNSTDGVDAGTWGQGFTSLIERNHLTPGFVLLAIAIAMFWGALHALSPGHGKTIVAAYLLGSRATARHAAFLGATVTVTHTAGVLALGLATLYLSQYIVPETLYPWLSLVSGVMVLGLGATMLTRRLGAVGAHHHHDEHHDGDHGHTHGPGGHTHLPPGAEGSPITMRGLLALGVSGGILPCPSALVVMLGSIALGRVAFGLVLVVAFSLGLAMTLTGVGLLVIHARRLVERIPVSGRALVVLPGISAFLISVLGGVLTARAVHSFPGGTVVFGRLDEWLAGFGNGHSVVLVAAVAVLLGLRHATDPDHLAAIATIAVAGETRGRTACARLGAAWGTGHALTLLVFGLPIVLFHGYLPDVAQRAAEALVGVTIVALALRLLWRARMGAFHAHGHSHVLDGEEVSHTHGHTTRAAHRHRVARTPWQAFGIGLVHGTGGSAGVGIVLLASVHDRPLAVLALLLFAGLTAVSMTVLSTGLGVVITGRWARNAFERMAPAVGVTSLLFGCWYLLGALQLAAYPF
jgi:ABC-type nickel/cobalt efflux system permease component RcnA